MSNNPQGHNQMTPADPSNAAPDRDKTYAMLSEAAQTLGDRFMVRIFRKRTVNAIQPEILAIFANTTLEQISQPEPWIFKLAGGGEYVLQVAHMDRSSVRIGGFLKFPMGGEMRPVWPQAIKSEGWEGPELMTYPQPGSVAWNAGQAAAPGAANPLGPPPANAWGPPAPPLAVAQVPPPGVPADALFQREQAALAAHTLRERELAQREAILQKQMIEREETVKRAELEQRMRNEGNDRARALEDKIERLLAAQSANAKPGPSIGETIAAITAAFTPIVTTMLAGAAESRVAAARQAAEQAARSDAQAAANQTMLLSMLNKPAPGIPAEVTMLFEMQKNQSAGSADMMTRIIDAMGAVSKTSVAMIEAVSEMNFGGEPENPMLQVVRESVKAVSGLISGAKDGAKKQVQAQQAPQRAPQPLPAQAAPQQTNGQNGHAPGSQAMPAAVAGPAAGATATGPQAPAPVQVTQFPPQQAQPEQVQQQTSIAEPPRDSVQEMERLIRNRYEPIENVALFFVQAVKTDEMKRALAEVEGDINELMKTRLGDWIEQSTQNYDYITRLAEAVDVAGTAAGIFRPEDQDDADDDDQDQQDADAQQQQDDSVGIAPQVS